MTRQRLLYVTDLAYPAQGRRYGDEDLWLSARLRTDFDVTLCHPVGAPALVELFDLVVVRNSGPVIHRPNAYDRFRRRVDELGARVFNESTGQADMRGKQYLVDLTREGARVIPTIDADRDRPCIAGFDGYVVKPKLGSDSVGLRVIDGTEVEHVDLADGSTLVQPLIDFIHEVSLYFVDHTFHYALHAPDPSRRWELQPFEPSAVDLAFAQWFIEWNDIRHGIQRVDACRLASGELVLMELEDLNPYLSLHVVDETVRARFVAAMIASLHDQMQP